MIEPKSARKILRYSVTTCFCDFGETTFTKRRLQEFVDGQTGILNEELNKWKEAGIVRIIIPLATAKDDEVCIEMLKPVYNPYNNEDFAP